MEWVETTGKTLEVAKEAALDELGVGEEDVEFEILDEPRTGLFGRVRGEARIRARIQPTQPRAKVERGRRKREGKPRGNGGSGNRGGGNSNSGAASKSTGKAAKPARSTEKAAAKPASIPSTPSTPSTPQTAADGAGTTESRVTSPGVKQRKPAPRRSSRRETGERPGLASADKEPETGPDSRPQSPPGGPPMSADDVTVEEQAELTATFLGGLVEAFGLEATLERVKIDDDTIEVHVNGDDLGILIGPKGQTLQAVQELSRTYIQRKATGTHHGRVRIDVAGYRQRRREALERFTTQVAEQVVETGVQKALEPMNAADRKVVHDTANGIDGVKTLSEGEDPRRRVVIAPE